MLYRMKWEPFLIFSILRINISNIFKHSNLLEDYRYYYELKLIDFLICCGIVFISIFRNDKELWMYLAFIIFITFFEMS